MRFLLVFLLCLFATGQAGAYNGTETAQSLSPAKGGGQPAFHAISDPNLVSHGKAERPALQDKATACYQNTRFGFSLCWLPGTWQIREADNGDGVMLRDNQGFTLLAYGTNGYAVLGQNMEDALAEFSSTLDSVTYKRRHSANGWFVVSGFQNENIVYLKCFFREDTACIVQMTYPADKANVYTPHVEQVVKTFRLEPFTR